MKKSIDLPQRKSIRLQNYDYTQEGAYFITICTQHRKCLFGKIVNEKMELNKAGEMIDIEWNALFHRFQYIQLDEYIIMPNHFHAILHIVGAPLVGARHDTRAGTRPAPTKPNLTKIIGAFKSITTQKYINGIKNYHWTPFDKKLWQRNYYEHVIRNEESLGKLQEYILYNPINWKKDELFLP